MSKKPQIYSKTISVGTTKINANYTAEMYSDLMAYHGIDPQKELDDILKWEMKKELRRTRKEKLNKLKNIWDNE